MHIIARPSNRWGHRPILITRDANNPLYVCPYVRTPYKGT